MTTIPDWVEPWVRRAQWCDQHRQPLYVTSDEADQITADYRAAITDDLMAGRIDKDDPRIKTAETLDLRENESRLHGVAVVVDEPKARRQHKLYASGERPVPCRGGPLDGEIAPDVSTRLLVAGADGYYAPVPHIDDRSRAIGWVWVPKVEDE